MNSVELGRPASYDQETIRCPLRTPEVGFENERIRYEEALREAYTRGPVSGYERELHLSPWPVDLANGLAHITCYYFDTNYSAQALQPNHKIHGAVDVQVPRDSEVFAPADVLLVGYRVDHSRNWLSDIYLYDADAELLYILAHLNPSAVLKDVRDNPGFPRIPKVRLSKGQSFGTVGRFFAPDSGLPSRVVVPPDVYQQYERTYDHLHIETHPLKSEELDVVNGFFNGSAVNPLLVFEKVY